MKFRWDTVTLTLADGRRRCGKVVLQIQWRPHCVELCSCVPYWASARYHTPRWALEIDVGMQEAVKSTMADFLKKAIDSLAGPAGAVHFRDQELEKLYPALYDFLSCRIGPNGKEREGSCLLVYARDGEVVACLKDRNLKRSWFGRADSLQAAFGELEASLRAFTG